MTLSDTSAAFLIFLSSISIANKSFAFDLPPYLERTHSFKLETHPLQPKKEIYKSKTLHSYRERTFNTTYKISNKYNQWKGVKYKLGGDSQHGIDCSAFTRRVLKDFSIHLPRTTSEQIRSGKSIHKKELKAGDLVFFKTSRQERHVGVYVGNDQFIHASRKKGVTTSSLKNSYWKERYETSVRVIG